ncbi:hypothetical protein [Nocardia araoensis]|uniref:hypothetical protein n=1 Tax=Nocardia araoensis TaxID=228600 RepID=UPI0002F55A97|nr:hypothetical protein [Nocardia araoensis]
MTARDLELITVSDRSVAVTWTTAAIDRIGRKRPVAADTELALGPADSSKPLPIVYSDPTPTAFHYVEVTGLEPGRLYRMEARSPGRACDIGFGRALVVERRLRTRIPHSHAATGTVAAHHRAGQRPALR